MLAATNGPERWSNMCQGLQLEVDKIVLSSRV
jgi:hypothetical protein